MNIVGNIAVPKTSTLTIAASGSITVGNSSTDYTVTQLDGFYSAGTDLTNANASFIIGGSYSFTTSSNSRCPVEDPQLFINGSVVYNADGKGGIFTNHRDLCIDDLTKAPVTFSERPDFYLNAPDLIKRQNNVWQEVAP